MSIMDKVADRYERDPQFHTLVSWLEKAIEDLELSPSEIREAAMYACFRVQMRRAPTVFFPNEDR
jgi:hypothetical protein